MRLTLAVLALLAVSASTQELSIAEQEPEFTVIDILAIKDVPADLFTATTPPSTVPAQKKTSAVSLWVDAGVWRDTWHNPFAGRPAATVSHSFVQLQAYRRSWQASMSGWKNPVLGLTYGVGNAGPVQMGITLHGAQVFREDPLVTDPEMRLSIERKLRWMDGGVDAGIGGYGGRNGHLSFVVGYLENRYGSRLTTPNTNDVEPLSYDRSTLAGLHASGQWIIPGRHTITIQGWASYLQLFARERSPFVPAREISATGSVRVKVWRRFAVTLRGGVASEYAASLLNDRSVRIAISRQLK